MENLNKNIRSLKQATQVFHTERFLLNTHSDVSFSLVAIRLAYRGRCLILSDVPGKYNRSAAVLVRE